MDYISISIMSCYGYYLLLKYKAFLYLWLTDGIEWNWETFLFCLTDNTDS